MAYPRILDDIEQLKEGKADKSEIQGVSQQVTEHLAESMPHVFKEGETTYRYGWKVIENDLIFIYEEVL